MNNLDCIEKVIDKVIIVVGAICAIIGIISWVVMMGWGWTISVTTLKYISLISASSVSTACFVFLNYTFRNYLERWSVVTTAMMTMVFLLLSAGLSFLGPVKAFHRAQHLAMFTSRHAIHTEVVLLRMRTGVVSVRFTDQLGQSIEVDVDSRGQNISSGMKLPPIYKWEIQKQVPGWGEK